MQWTSKNSRTLLTEPQIHICTAYHMTNIIFGPKYPVIIFLGISKCHYMYLQHYIVLNPFFAFSVSLHLDNINFNVWRLLLAWSQARKFPHWFLHLQFWFCIRWKSSQWVFFDKYTKINIYYIANLNSWYKKLSGS